MGSPSWFQHVDLMNVLITALFGIVAWFLVRTLKKIDANQALLVSRIDCLSKDFYHLKGEHDAIKENCRAT